MWFDIRETIITKNYLATRKIKISTLTEKEMKSEQNMMKSLQKDKICYFFIISGEEMPYDALELQELERIRWTCKEEENYSKDAIN